MILKYLIAKNMVEHLKTRRPISQAVYFPRSTPIKRKKKITWPYKNVLSFAFAHLKRHTPLNSVMLAEQHPV